MHHDITCLYFSKAFVTRLSNTYNCGSLPRPCNSSINPRFLKASGPDPTPPFNWKLNKRYLISGLQIQSVVTLSIKKSYQFQH